MHDNKELVPVLTIPEYVINRYALHLSEIEKDELRASLVFKAHSLLKKHDPREAQLSTYLSRCLENEALYFIRQNKAKQNKHAQFQEHSIGYGEDELVFGCPSQELNDDRVRKMIEKLMGNSKLDSQSREILKLRFWHEMTIEGIANQLKLSTRKVRESIQRSIDDLRSALFHLSN